MRGQALKLDGLLKQTKRLIRLNGLYLSRCTNIRGIRRLSDRMHGRLRFPHSLGDVASLICDLDALEEEGVEEGCGECRRVWACGRHRLWSSLPPMLLELLDVRILPPVTLHVLKSSCLPACLPCR